MPWYCDPQLKNCRHIVIKDVERNMMIGAYDHEKQAPQPVVINVELFVRTADEGDQLENAYNYDEVMETLVDSLAQQLLNNPLVQAVVVRSEKTKAYPDVKSASVEIFRVCHD